MPALPESRRFVGLLPPYPRVRRGGNLYIGCKVNHLSRNSQIFRHLFLIQLLLALSRKRSVPFVYFLLLSESKYWWSSTIINDANGFRLGFV